MASLTITVPDAVVSRIRTAFGRTDPNTGIRVPATTQEIEAALKSSVKGTVLEYEASIAANLKRDAVGGETW